MPWPEPTDPSLGSNGRPRVDQPTWILDWVGLFEGADADERRSLIDSRDWEERIRPDLLEIRNRLQEAGEHQLLIRTVARQAVTFLVGFHLRRTAQFDVTFTQRGALWSSIDRMRTSLALKPSRKKGEWVLTSNCVHAKAERHSSANSGSKLGWRKFSGSSIPRTAQLVEFEPRWLVVRPGRVVVDPRRFDP